MSVSRDQFFLLLIIIFIIVSSFLLLNKYGFAFHDCYTNTTSLLSHFDTANLTITTNITHDGYCLAF